MARRRPGTRRQPKRRLPASRRPPPPPTWARRNARLLERLTYGVLGVLALGMTLLGLTERASIDTRLARAHGVVVRDRSSGRGPDEIDVEFTVDGRRVVARMFGSHEEGDEVEIEYDAADPETARLRGDAGDEFGLVLFAAGAVALFWCAWRPPRRRRPQPH